MQIGPYRVVKEIARGGMGVVYRAQAPSGDEVALKVLQAKRSSEPQAHVRFQREAKALTGLVHPHVVRLLDSGVFAGSPWLALELIEGQTLQDALRNGPLPIDDAIEVTRQLGEALAYVHEQGLCHRDLKPDNILLRGRHALLTDFGLALAGDLDSTRLTRTGVFLGTPGYWAPEQAWGKKQLVGPRTDLYGLGAVLYACLTGRAPVEAENLQAFLASVEFRTIQPPHAQRTDVPRWLSKLCMRCLEGDPAKRPASASEVVRSLELQTSGDRPRGRGLTAGLAAAAAALVLALTVVIWPAAAPPSTTPVHAEPDDPTPRAALPGSSLQHQAGIDGWPTGLASEAIAIHEPWAFRRTPQGLKLEAHSTSRPEIGLPLSYGGGPWDARVTLAQLRLLGPGWIALTVGTLPPSLRHSAPPVEDQPPLTGMGWLLRRTPQFGLVAIPVTTGRVRREPRYPLEVDPRGPLSLHMSWREPQLTLTIVGPSGVLATHKETLPQSAIPTQAAALRLGQFSPQRFPSRGKHYTPWHDGVCELTLGKLDVWGPSLRLDTARPQNDPPPDSRKIESWVEGQIGWGFVSGEKRDNLRNRLARADTRGLLATSDRYSLYVLAMLAARDGEHEEAAQKLSALNTLIAGFEPEATEWTSDRHWIRNRILCDFVHYPPELRTQIVQSVPFLRTLPEAQAAARGGPVVRTEFSSSAHSRMWAAVEVALHFAGDPNRARDPSYSIALSQSTAFEEARQQAAALGKEPTTPRKAAARGLLAFYSGRYREAAAYWNRFPSCKDDPNIAQACAVAERWSTKHD